MRVLRGVRLFALLVATAACWLGTSERATAAGAWVRQGDPTVDVGLHGAREFDAQGAAVKIREANNGSVTMSAAWWTGTSNTVVARFEWILPQNVYPGEVVDVGASVTVLSAELDARFPASVSAPTCVWGGDVLFSGPAFRPATGATRTEASTHRIPAGAPGPGAKIDLHCGASFNAYNLLTTWQSYVWSENAPAPPGRTAQPPVSSPAERPPAGDVAGTWSVRFNESTGTMELTPAAGSWSARLALNGSTPEPLVNVGYDPASGRLTFDRPSTPGQHYTGTLDAGAFTGTFRQDGSSVTYAWTARRAVSATAPPAAPGEFAPQTLFFNGNDAAVGNGGKVSAFTLPSPAQITFVMTYHWNGGRGAPAGTIALLAESGIMYGPWQATLNNGVYWEVRPNAGLPAGRYRIIDSDPATWAQNAGSNGDGMTRVLGFPR